MKTISISQLRQGVADVLDEVQASDEPTVVLQRSQKAAYIVGPERYERDQAELDARRRTQYLSEVRESEAEYAAGNVSSFDEVELDIERSAQRPNPLNVVLDPEHAAKLQGLADRTYVNPGTLARSLLSTALDRTDPDVATITALLDTIPGAFQRTQQGLKDVRAGRVISLDDL